MRSVLFICTANICRSPLAMGLWQAQVCQVATEWRVGSAGVWAPGGSPVAQNTQAILKNRGVDLSTYRSRKVTAEILKDFNLILTMERGQKEALKLAFPQFAARIYLLSEMVGQIFEIEDPIGQDLSEFIFTAQEIDQILSEGSPRIYMLAENQPASNDH